MGPWRCGRDRGERFWNEAALPREAPQERGHKGVLEKMTEAGDSQERPELEP
jgi:hypothetical protein